MLHRHLRKFFSTAVEKQVTLTRLANEHRGISVFEMNNPASRNALSQKLIEDLNSAIDETELAIGTEDVEKECRVVILRSKIPGTFCSGADLRARLTMTKQATESFVCLLRDTFHRLYTLPVPVIACIDGFALGGGLELALSCDIRVATETSLIGLTETGLAIIPGAGGTQKLSRIVGLPLAKEMVFTAKKFKAPEAHRLGLINYVEKGYEDAYNRSLAIAKEILPRGPVAIRMAKQALNASLETDLSTGLQIEKMLYSKIIDTEDRIEGIKSFLEKREPKYKGIYKNASHI